MFIIDFSQSFAKLRPVMSEYGHISQKPAPLLSYNHGEARKAARRKIIDEALQRRGKIYKHFMEKKRRLQESSDVATIS